MKWVFEYVYHNELTMKKRKLLKNLFMIVITGLILFDFSAAAQHNLTGISGKAITYLDEADQESGATIYLLGADERPADNIYGEQPYNDPSGSRIAVRYYRTDELEGGISLVDLVDGSIYEVMKGDPRFPAFHAWGDYIFFQEKIDGNLLLRSCHYNTLEKKNIAILPSERGSYSYGTVSQDLQYYVVCIRTPSDKTSAEVHLLDLGAGEWSVLLQKEGYHAKHEQFSRDGSNRILIQLNQMPGVKQVLLGELNLNGELKIFPADRPYTSRPTGHEAWIGNSTNIFFSTGRDSTASGNIWSAASRDFEPKLVYKGSLHFGHISISYCGNYWIGDTNETNTPIYIGSFVTGKCKRLVFSHTENDGKQWSHTHPYLTADNKWLIYTSRRNGHPQVYGAKLKEYWLKELNEM
jgi:hypothetical protein